MATIKINDLQMSEELDKQALSRIRGAGRMQARSSYSGTADTADWSLINRHSESGFSYLSEKHIARGMKKS